MVWLSVSMMVNIKGYFFSAIGYREKYERIEASSRSDPLVMQSLADYPPICKI